MINTNKIRFVLSRTTHPGNIGGVARAIKNMGFRQLYLVSPLNYPHEEAIARSSGAEDILENAKIVDSLEGAVTDCNIIFGTSARRRSLPWPLLNASECAYKMKEYLMHENTVAVIFGQERTGLTNAELALCHYHLNIPCDSEFASLNLVTAVAIVAYELRDKLFNTKIQVENVEINASAQDMERFYKHLEQTLIKINFLDPENPRLLMRKLRRLFNRSLIQTNELNILRGILTAIDTLKGNDN